MIQNGIFLGILALVNFTSIIMGQAIQFGLIRIRNTLISVLRMAHRTITVDKIQT